MRNARNRTSGPWVIKNAIVLTKVNEEDHLDLPQGLFRGLLNIFLIAEESVGGEPIKVRVAHDEHEAFHVEKVNSLVGKKVSITVNVAPWTVVLNSGTKSGVVNYLASIEEIRS